jgi:hypothetical protein
MNLSIQLRRHIIKSESQTCKWEAILNNAMITQVNVETKTAST